MDDVMRLCCNLSANQQIKVAVKNSSIGAAVAGGTAFIGGLLAGPPGLAAGEVEVVLKYKIVLVKLVTLTVISRPIFFSHKEVCEQNGIDRFVL